MWDSFPPFYSLCLFCFVVGFFAQLHLINLSQHQEGNNKVEEKKGEKVFKKMNIIWQFNSLKKKIPPEISIKETGDDVEVV